MLQGSLCLQVLLQLWKHECKRVIADRFTSPNDVAWFDQTLADLAKKELGEAAKATLDPGLDSYFVDFLKDAPEATGTIEQPNSFHICTGINLI